jgi:hypothetical protein
MLYLGWKHKEQSHEEEEEVEEVIKKHDLEYVKVDEACRV